jgi:hypothetical protein
LVTNGNNAIEAAEIIERYLRRFVVIEVENEYPDYYHGYNMTL